MKKLFRYIFCDTPGKISRWRVIAAAGVFFVLSVNVIVILNYIIAPKPFNIQTYLATIQTKNEDTFEYIRSNLSEIIEQGGVHGAAQLTKKAFEEELIGMYECHTLAHSIGHKSKLTFEENFSLITDVGVDFCGGGFKHGMEAEIALRGLRQGTDFRSQLYELCRLLRDISTGCYHGSGHEFMGQTMDPKKALALCDTLTGGPENDLSYCYAGVFSEYTNLLGGIDGETGYRLTTGPPITLTMHPLDFCMTFEERFQLPCALEVNGFQNSHPPTLTYHEQALMKCTDTKYPEPLQKACLRSIAAVSTQHALVKNATILPPESVLFLPTNLRRAYIGGVGYEMGQYLMNGLSRDWESFCSAFPTEDYTYCSDIIASS